MYSPLAGRLLHDRTADKIAQVISRIPGASAQILTYDVGLRVAQALRGGDEDDPGRAPESTGQPKAATPASG
jgi:hypothetical protein